MPALANPRHEAFAQLLAQGMSAFEAYDEAGYMPSRSAASRLSTNVSVRARVAEIKARAAVRVEVTQASLIAEAEEARVAAMERGQLSAAVAAIKEKGVLAGIRVEKRENAHRTVNDMSDDELAAIAAGGRASAPGSQSGTQKPH